jgi:zinc protease
MKNWIATECRLALARASRRLGFNGKSLVEDFDRLLNLAADVVMHPIFPRDETEKLRAEILADLKEAEQDTAHVAYREFRKLCYPSAHPYHRLSDGTPATVKRLTRAQMREFHARYFSSRFDDARRGGAMCARTLPSKRSRARSASGAPRAPPPLSAIPSAPPLKQIARRVVPLDGKTQADVVLGFPALCRADPDFYALSLGDLIFGRLGLYGRLGASVRDEQGLAYYVFSSIEAGLGAGPWSVRAGVNPKNLERAIEGILAEIRRLRSAQVTQDELDEARDFLTGSLALRLETNDGVAAILSDIELFDLGLDYLQRYPQIVRSITAEQILVTVQKYAQVENYALAIAGPVEQ